MLEIKLLSGFQGTPINQIACHLLIHHGVYESMVGTEEDDWYTTRSDLWLLVVDKFHSDPTVNLSLDKQEVLLSGEVKKS